MIHICAVSAKRKQYLEDSEDEAEFVEIEEEDEETYCKFVFCRGGGGGGGGSVASSTTLSAI